MVLFPDQFPFSNQASPTATAPTSETTTTTSTQQNFADVTQEPTITQWSATKGMVWRQCTKGLCLSGVCTNHSCMAFSNHVICRPFSHQKEGQFSWRLNDRQVEIFCPCCRSPVIPINAKLNNCFFRIHGIRQDSTVFNGHWRQAKDECTSWSTEGGNGLASWKHLEIFVRMTPKFL